MDKPSSFSDFINSHPKIPWMFLLIIVALFWQSIVLLVGLILYVILVRILRTPWWLLLGIGSLTACTYVYGHSFIGFFRTSYYTNIAFWKQFLSSRPNDAFYWSYRYNFEMIFGFSLLVAGLFSALDQLSEKFHARAFKQLENGITQNIPELDDKKIKQLFNNFESDIIDGTFLGISKYSGERVLIKDADVNQVVLVLGTTGGGKTITLRRFYERAIQSNQPLIIVDGKPDDKNIAWLKAAADTANKPFYGFNCVNFLHYNCLAHGGYTELKDKIICLKDEWSSDYYRSIAEDYLQTTIEVLLKSQTAFDLRKIADCLDYSELILLGREVGDNTLINRIKNLKKYEMKDITGLQAHLNLLINSELGHFFINDSSSFSIKEVIEKNALVYFALPALKFPSFAKVLGKLVINDLKAVISNQQYKKVFTIFDEFSVFVSDQVKNLVNMGRGKGVHAVFGTQGLAELKEINPSLMEQILNCVNTLLCHRINDSISAQLIADWVGTQNTFAVTAQLDIHQSGASAGSVRSTKEYIVHPDQIKQDLSIGELFYITKVNGFRTDKVTVKFS